MSTINAASASYADVNYACNTLATYGDTVIVPAGSATWTSSLTITKAIIVKCAGVGRTIITNHLAGNKNTRLINYIPDAYSIANDLFFRWTGTSFISTGYTTSIFCLYNRTAHTPMTKNRIDHVDSVGLDINARFLEIDGHFYGVMDHYSMDSGTLEVYGSNEISWTYFTATPGGADNFFFEDGTVYCTGSNYGWGSGAGGRYCVRHNLIDATGALGSVMLFDVHGSMYTNGNLGSMIFECYENTINFGANGGYFGDLRGGQSFVYNNHVDTSYTVHGPSIREELIDTICPPANNVIDGTPQHVHDSYLWNNIMHKGGNLTRFDWIPNGTVDYAAGQTDTTNGQFYPPAPPYRIVPQEGLDFWTQHDSFNGQVGVGVGLLADRPSQNLVVGVGWWATDENTLYRATGPTTWQVYYRPYQYPHPLREEDYPIGGNTTLTPLSAAIGLSASTPTLDAPATYTLTVDSAVIAPSTDYVVLVPVAGTPWDISLGPEGAEQILPLLNWPSGSSPEMPIGRTAYVDKSTAVDGLVRYNFRLYSPRSWTLTWERLTSAQVAQLKALAAYNEPLHFQNKFIDASWHWVLVTELDIAASAAMFTVGADVLGQYKVTLTLEEIC